MAGLLAFLPAAIRASAPYLGRGIAKIGRGLRQLPGVGTQVEKTFPGVGPGMRTTASQRREAAINLGLGGIEAGAAADAFTDPEATLFDKAIGATYGLGAFQFGRRGYQMARSANLGTRMPPKTEFGRRIERAQIPAVAGDVLLGGPREVELAPPVPKDQAVEFSKLTDTMNDDEKKIMNDFLSAYPGGRGASRDVINSLQIALENAKDPVQSSKNQETITGEEPIIKTEKQQEETIKVSKEAEKVIGKPTVDPDATDGVELDKTLNEADKAAKSVINKPRYTDLNTGDVGALFEKLRVKKTDYARSDKAIKDYQDLIQTQASKIKTFDQYKKEYEERVGDGDETLKNVTMLKWGLSLMQGTSTQGGIAGAIDAVSKASMPFANDLQALAASEKQENQAIAQQFMQYEKAALENLDQAQRTALEMNIAQAQRLETANTALDSSFLNYNLELIKLNAEREKTIQEAINKAGNLSDKKIIKQSRDPNAIGEVKNMVYSVGKDDGRPKLIRNGQVIDVLNTPGLAEEFEAGEDITGSIDKKGLRTARGALSSLNEGIRYADIVLGLQNSGGAKVGTQIAFNRSIINLKSFISDFTGMMSTSTGDDVPGKDYDFTQKRPDYDIEKSILLYRSIDPTDNDYADENTRVLNRFRTDMREAVELGKKLNDPKFEGRKGIIDKYMKNMKIKEDYKTDDAAKQIAQLLVIEQRMKYILANANKREDRLTVKDVEDAASRTQIFKILGGSTEIINSYEVLRTDLIRNARDRIAEYKGYGGRDSGIDHLVSIPDVETSNNRILASKLGKAVQRSGATTEQSKEEIKNNVLNQFFDVLKEEAP